MTHEEIVAAIGRLRKLSNGCRIYTSTEVMNAITDGPWVNDLIALLRQADPDTHMELPKDADGECIHIGDEMEYKSAYESKHSTVEDISCHLNGGVCARLSCGVNWYNVADLRHYHAPTVEDVLHRFARDIADVLGGEDFLLRDDDELYADYAAKLQLREA